VTHEDVTFEQLGGALVHNTTSGVRTLRLRARAIASTSSACC
jgi:acetyl-CoA carboxylase carboxyltransferase component